MAWAGFENVDLFVLELPRFCNEKHSENVSKHFLKNIMNWLTTLKYMISISLIERKMQKDGAWFEQHKTNQGEENNNVSRTLKGKTAKKGKYRW